MSSFFSNFFGKKTKIDFEALIGKGAILLDVRTKEEFGTGHIRRARNIPLSELGKSLNKIKKDQVIITCCRSGARSRIAQGLLERQGYQHVYNGGAWTKLKNQIPE